MAKQTYLRIKIITPIGIYHSKIAPCAADAKTNFDEEFYQKIVSEGTYFQIEGVEGQTMYFGKEVIRNSIIIVERIEN